MDKILDIEVKEEIVMYHHRTQAEKQAAIDLYISSGFSPTAVKRKLGYPSRSQISRWYHDYLKDGYVRGPDKWSGKFTDEQKQVAVDHYLANGRNGSKTVRDPGYPSRTLLTQWIDELAPGERKCDKPHKRLTEADKASVLARAYSGATPVKETVDTAGINKVTFYNWRKEFLGKGAQNVADGVRDEELSEDVEALKAEIEKLKAAVRFHKMEVAVWKGAAELVKKRPGHRPEPADEQGEGGPGERP